MKTVIEMARSVGARPQQNKNCDVEYLFEAEALERFAELVRAEEREACAKVVEEYPHWLGMTAKAEISNAIRARGETK